MIRSAEPFLFCVAISSFLALGNGVDPFFAVGPCNSVALDAKLGKLLKEFELAPAPAGPPRSSGHDRGGDRNTLFFPDNAPIHFPEQHTTKVCGSALPDADATDQSATNEDDEAKPEFQAPDDVTYRKADIISEGTRMTAELFAPKFPNKQQLPTIIMSHGWGGTAASLRPDAIVFARAGYLVVAFDYRGWGVSDSRWVPAGPKPVRKDGKLIVEVKEVREVVDPIDQTTDILNAIHWAVGEKLCDPNRIGIWGSSFSGGHVVYVAARDPRVKAFVSQVGSMDGRWVTANPQLKNFAFSQGTMRTRGQIGYPRPGERFGSLTGIPVIEKLIGYAPIDDVQRSPQCAKLFIIAEKEELFDNKENAILAHERATGAKKLISIPGIKHYGIYNEARGQAQKAAIEWFDLHLKTAASGKPPR